MFRVLHISDVHIASANASVISDRIAAIIVAVAGHLPVDVVAFTGDATQRADEDQFNLFGKRVVDPLLQALGLNASRFLIVPGNHDVQRPVIDEFLELGFHQKLPDPDAVDAIWRSPKHRRSALERLDRFHEWASKKGLQAKSATYRLDGRDIGFACINSAWLSGRDRERHDLAISRAQAMECEDAISDAEFKIALWHHPLEWLHDSDKGRIRELLFTKFDAYLQGHLHDGDGSQIVSPRGNTVSLQAPAVHSSRCYSGFQLYDFDVAAKKASALSYRLNEKRLEYVLNIDVIPDGTPWNIELMPVRTDSRALASVQTLNSSLGSKYAASLERLVPVVSHLRKLPIAERLLPQHVTLVGSKSKTPLRLSRIVNDDASYLILGDQHSGKTTFLEVLGMRLVGQGALAALATPDRLSSIEGRDGLIRTLSDTLGETVTQARRLADSDVVLMVDEANRGITGKQWAVLGSWMDACPRLRLVVACSQPGLTSAGSYAKRFKIGRLEPLSVGTIQAEVRRLGELLSLSPGVSVEKALDTLIDAELPRWPWAVLMLLDVTARGDGRDVSNLSGLLRRYTEHRLGATATPGEDAKVRARMLRLLAADMMTRRTCELPRPGVEALIADEVKRCNIPADGPVLLNDLFATRLIVADDDRVKFAFVVLQEFFFADHLSEQQWNGAAGLDADTFLRYAGSLAFLSEMAQVSGLAERGFELARCLVPQEAIPVAVAQVAAIAGALPSFAGSSPGDAAVEKAKKMAPDSEEREAFIEKAESGAQGTRGARVQNGKEKLQSLGFALEELIAAVAVLRSSAWLGKETKSQLVNDAIRMAAALVGEMSRDPDLQKLFEVVDPQAVEETNAIIVGAMFLFMGMVVTGQGGARHLSPTLSEVFDNEKDPIRRLLSLMWYFETDSLEARPKGDLLKKVTAFLSSAHSHAELGLLELWLVMKYITSYAYDCAGAELEECLRRVVSERSKGSVSREGAAAITDKKLAALKLEKAVVERSEGVPDRSQPNT